MPNRFLSCMAVLMVASAVPACIHAQTAAKPAAPPMQSGQTPDLSGVWDRGEKATMASYAPSDPSGMKGENPPMTPWGDAQFQLTKPAQGIRASNHSNDTTTFQCMPPGFPRIYMEPHPMQIFQVPGRVVMLFEFDHFFRTIYTDGRDHPKDLDPTWMGNAVGHWEGATLVVDTVGFNDKTWIDRAGHPHSDQLHLIERIRRIDHETLQDDITIDDPKAYIKPWTTRKMFKLRADWELLEDVCEEQGDYANLEKQVGIEPSK
jgi:hypothetical protein